MDIGKLLDWIEEPRGDTSKVMCFLSGGRFDGDRASIHPPAPDVLGVVPCDGTCRDEVTGKLCGMTHWHDDLEALVQGDMPKHAAFYVLVRTQPAPSGMRACLYMSVGHIYPSQAIRRDALNNFERHVAAFEATQQSPREGNNA